MLHISINIGQKMDQPQTNNKLKKFRTDNWMGFLAYWKQDLQKN